ncbi:MAG TPA: amidase [Fimbriimonadaceae bacterium]|jgi:aspartyl-tRNA(Asn)/glutamyl-tRNA(Gln) amidotransferase subunit A
MDCYSSITELSKALRKKEVSSNELTQMYLKRLRTLGKEYNAVAEITETMALEQAALADHSMGDKKSILNGIPYGAKDLYAVSGIPTRWGSPGHADQVFNYDSMAIEKLRESGAVLIGKLAMVELAGGGNYNVANASISGPGLSAWDKKLWAGGSSTGSGSATALGCVGFSLGSETSGSIVCPSAFNGATGFRPTYGRVSRYGAMVLCWTMDKLGPICRSAEDCGIVLDAIAGYDDRDPSSLHQKLNLRPRKKDKVTIGLLKEKFAENKATVCEKAYHDALDVFRKLGYETVDVAYPDLPYDMATGIIVDAEGASAHEHFVRGDNLGTMVDKNQVAGMAAALNRSAVDYLWAMRMRTEALKANSTWDKCDCVFTPTFYHKSVPVDQPFDKSFANMGGASGPENLIGWPALAFPIGFEDGAPLGGQILAPCFREDVCYRLATEFQKETDFHSRKPVPAEG